MAGGWWLVAGGWWLVAGGWWLVAGGWWLVAGGWWLVAGGWWLVAGGNKTSYQQPVTRNKFLLLNGNFFRQKFFIHREFHKIDARADIISK